MITHSSIRSISSRHERRRTSIIFHGRVTTSALSFSSLFHSLTPWVPFSVVSFVLVYCFFFFPLQNFPLLSFKLSCHWLRCVVPLDVLQWSEYLTFTGALSWVHPLVHVTHNAWCLGVSVWNWLQLKFASNETTIHAYILPTYCCRHNWEIFYGVVAVFRYQPHRKCQPS